MSAKLLILTVLALAASLFASMDNYIMGQNSFSAEIPSSVASIDFESTINILNLAAIDSGNNAVIPPNIADTLERIPTTNYYTSDSDDNNDRICVLDIRVTPDEAYVLPGAFITFRTTTPNVKWYAKYGKIVKSGSYAKYQAPTDLQGNSELVDEVYATKSSCAGKAKVYVMADSPALMDIDAPDTVNLNENANIYALVKDKYGNPVSGKRIKFSLSVNSGVPAASLKVGSDDGLVVTSVTNDKGKAAVVFKAGGKVENYTLTVQYDRLREVALISVMNSSNNSTTNNNTNGTSTNNNNTSVNSGGGSGENTGRLGTTSVNATVTRAEQNNTVAEPVVEPEVKPEVVTPAADSAKAAEVHVTYYKNVVLGSDITLVLKDADGKLLPGKKVTITGPDGKAVELISSWNGVVKYTPTIAGEYKVKVDGTDTEIIITVSAKSVAGAGEEKSSEATFDIVAALTGGNASSFSIIAVLIVVLILIVGAAVYFFTKQDEM